MAAALYSTVATLGHITAGLGVGSRPEWSLGFVYLPAFLVIGIGGAVFGLIGVKLGAHIPEVWLRRLLALFLFVAAIAIVLR